MKSTAYIDEIINQKDDKYLSVGRNCLVASCQLRNFLRRCTEKCFAIFDQSSCMIYSILPPVHLSGNIQDLGYNFNTEFSVTTLIPRSCYILKST